MIVIPGRQSFSALSSDRQMVPEGYTLGWNRGGVNWPVVFWVDACK